jgi:hypothetical protein
MQGRADQPPEANSALRAERLILNVGQKMKPLLVFLAVCFLTAVVSAQFEEKPIRASGVVTLEVFPGRPNYESIKDGDEREEAWILTTSKKERFQLVIIEDVKKKFATLRHRLGKNVSVAGFVWEGHTGHHHTEFLITLSSIQEEPNQSPQHNAGSRPFSD